MAGGEERVPSYEDVCGTTDNKGKLIDFLRPGSSIPKYIYIIQHARIETRGKNEWFRVQWRKTW